MRFIIDEISFDTRDYSTGLEDLPMKIELDHQYKGITIGHDVLDDCEDIGDVFSVLFSFFEKTGWLIHKAILRPIDIPPKFKPMFEVVQTDNENWGKECFPLYPDNFRRDQTIVIKPLNEVISKCCTG